MQKRSLGLEIRRDPVDLDPAFPICGGTHSHPQTDRPITFLHIHPCLELGYCHSGNGIFMIGEKVLPYQAGDISVINHTEAHLAKSTPGTASLWTWVFLDPVCLTKLAGADMKILDPTLLTGSRFTNILSSHEHPQIARVVLRLIDELSHKATNYATAVRALILELMILMHREAKDSGIPMLPPRLDYDRLGSALNYMAQHYEEPVDIPQLAKQCGMSESHFRRLFRQTIGCSPLTYWHDLRLRIAASLLRTTSQTVIEISQQTGFQNLSSFNRQFRSKFSMAPMAWRNSA